MKKVDPSIPVVATSVEPNEEYFQFGYGQWCDAFDFHVYETSGSVRKTTEEYHALIKTRREQDPYALRRVHLTAVQSPDRISYVIRDEGPGFDPAVVHAGSGHQHMADRLAALDGTLHVSSSPGHGTTVSGRLPAAKRSTELVAREPR